MLSKLLPRNEGTVDRAVRVLAGIAILSLAFIGPKSAVGLHRNRPDRHRAARFLPGLYPFRALHLPGQEEVAPVSESTTRFRPARFAS